MAFRNWCWLLYYLFMKTIVSLPFLIKGQTMQTLLSGPIFSNKFRTTQKDPKLTTNNTNWTISEGTERFHYTTAKIAWWLSRCRSQSWRCDALSTYGYLHSAFISKQTSFPAITIITVITLFPCDLWIAALSIWSLYQCGKNRDTSSERIDHGRARLNVTLCIYSLKLYIYTRAHRYRLPLCVLIVNLFLETLYSVF